MSDPNNPFAALIGVSEVQSTVDTALSDENLPMQNNSRIFNECEEVETINNIVENVFHFTINSGAVEGTSDRQLVYLEELARATKEPQLHIDLDDLAQALFERLLLTNIQAFVIPKNTTVFKEHVIQQHVFPYLFSSIQNLQNYDNVPKSNSVKNALETMRELVFRNAVTALKQPALFEEQDFAIQLVELLKNGDPQSQTFFTDIVQAFMADGDEANKDQLRDTMSPVLKIICLEIKKANIVNLPIYILPSLLLFASNQYLAPILMEESEPKKANHGKLYQDHVLGSVLALSVLPRTASAYPEFFRDPDDQSSISLVESSLWNATSHLNRGMHKIFLALLKGGPVIKDRVLTWFGRCLEANGGRGKLMNVQTTEATSSTLRCVSDGFMVNLGAVLLQLCQPFCTTSEDPKLLKIDPTYGAVLPEECESKSVHLRGLHQETCLLPQLDDVERPRAESYNFVTECFFLTQRCIDLGVRVCSEKLLRCSHELSQAQRTLTEAAAADPQLKERLEARFRLLLTRCLGLRCAVLEREMLTNLLRLQSMTCTWLVQVAGRPDPAAPQPSYAPGHFVPVQLPAAAPPPEMLRCIPEFVLENVIFVILMIRRLSEISGIEPDTVSLFRPALTMVLTFMGDSERTKNPHLRAHLAECLEAMLPHNLEEMPPLSSLAAFYRDQMFKEHPHRQELMRCILDVFVGIELTGTNVQFEEKFNYRRPMYSVMDYLWTVEEHKEALTKLAREAEANMEAVHPPIFLRFVNLLINDAIYLLDEALSNMAKIRTLQTAQSNGEWANLSIVERSQNQNNLEHIGLIARFDNVLGRDTVAALVRLSAHAPYVFCHPTLVERIASMLNYFLLHLVGPNKKNFKVKDMKEYDFEPARTVLDICRMYVGMGDNERFLEAVADDGRCYSPQLFTLAEDVLVRIGGGALVGSLQEVATRVASFAELKQCNEEMLASAPDEFLDPIMSTVMHDPVVLPSSRTTVDRNTIARHLLSDQSDPFNRSPLSMDQVKSNTELKERIQTWVAEQKQKFAQRSTSNTV